MGIASNPIWSTVEAQTRPGAMEHSHPALEQAHTTGPLFLITDNLSSHTSVKTRTWLSQHPRIQQVFLPKRAAWLNLQEGWWRLLRREAFAGQTFANRTEIVQATAVATHQLNQRAQPWVWGRPKKPSRYKRRVFRFCCKKIRERVPSYHSRVIHLQLR